jgi:hypothetical protein
VAWLPSGPLATGWARHAGTPANVLAKVGTTPSTSSTAVAPAPATSVPAAPFSAVLRGSLTQSNPNSNGQVTVRIDASLSGGATGALVIDLIGQPLSDGGVLLSSSQVGFGPVGQPSVYRGTVTSLRGQRIVSTLRATGRPSVALTADVQVAASGSSVTGTVSAQPLGAGG